MQTIADLMQQSGVTFGTSGARGLATAMSDQICFAYTFAFIRHLQNQQLIQPGDAIAIAGDYRPSTPRIVQAVALAITHAGYRPDYLGFIPTPALAFYGLQKGIASVMVTGSHIPDDRNGIKYYKPEGEILKGDEGAMRLLTAENPEGIFDAEGDTIIPTPLPAENCAGYQSYRQRFLDFFPSDALSGLNIGAYQHSSVARSLMVDILESLGADVTPLAPSEKFIPVDTEAVRPEDIALAKGWAEEYHFDAIISTDGDGDRPLLAATNGEWLRGDVIGVLTSKALGATAVVTPINSNSVVEKCGLFNRVIFSQIGSPFVIEQMQILERDDPGSIVVGYEANGGFLQQSNIVQNGRSLAPLPTRDALIVPIAILAQARAEGVSISNLLDRLPSRYTASDRMKEIPVEKSRQLISELDSGESGFSAISAFIGSAYAEAAAIDRTDGLRIILHNDEVIHLRPSGNAPELRCYSEADTPERAREMVDDILAKIGCRLR